MMEASIYFRCDCEFHKLNDRTHTDAQTVDDFLCVCIQLKRPVFSINSFSFFWFFPAPMWLI
jgi:hypothetical protein